jgi:hypothetical protein
MPDSRRVGRRRIGRRWSAKAILYCYSEGTGVCSSYKPDGPGAEGRWEDGNAEWEAGMMMDMTGLTARGRRHHDQMVKLPFSIFYQLVRLLFRSLEGELEASCCTGHDNTEKQKISIQHTL